MENRNPYGVDDKEEEIQGAEYGDVPSMSSPHTRVTAEQINPTGTGCRTLIIFILIISVVLGFIYLYKQNLSPDQPIPGNAPTGQTQQ